jgi:HK97 family phage major capsid protein/HK97 family phage prohead protease
MKVNMPMAVTAADTIKRTITGTIVTWNEQGNTSVGPTIFAADSIEIKPVRLLLEHDRTRPIGKMLSHNVTANGIEATFKIANTMAGEDALIEATEGLRDGFSVGAQINEWTNNKGVMQITSATLDEVSLVTDPAIDSARVAEVVAASENEAPKEDSDLATADSDKPTEGDQVSDTTAPAPAVEEAVEAAKVEAAAPKPAFYTSPRLEFTKAKYLEMSVRAALGNDDARAYVRAADDTTSNNAGLIPTRQLTEVINPLANADRPAVDSVSRGVLPDAGMSFEIPKLTAVPTVGEEAEEATIDETGMTSEFLSVSVKKYAGGQEFSVELLDRSSPAFFDELVRQMEYAYAKATDVAVVTGLIAGGTDGGNRTLDAAGLLDFVSDAGVSIYSNTLGFAQNIIASPQQWGAIQNLADAGRPIYQNLIGNMNQGGNLGAGSATGNLLGLNFRVDRNLTTGSGVGDNTIIIINPEAYTWYESSRFRLETAQVATGQIKVAYYGYGALATKVGAGAYRWMVA